MDIKNHSKYGTIGSWHGMLKEGIVVSTARPIEDAEHLVLFAM